MVDRLTRDAVIALPVTIDVPTAGRAFGLGRTTSYAMARAGEFPCLVLSFGSKYVVKRSDLLAALDVDPDQAVDGGTQPENRPRAPLDALDEVLAAIPDPIARHAAYILLARLIETGRAERGESRT